MIVYIDSIQSLWIEKQEQFHSLIISPFSDEVKISLLLLLLHSLIDASFIITTCLPHNPNHHLLSNSVLLRSILEKKGCCDEWLFLLADSQIIKPEVFAPVVMNHFVAGHISYELYHKADTQNCIYLLHIVTSSLVNESLINSISFYEVVVQLVKDNVMSITEITKTIEMVDLAITFFRMKKEKDVSNQEFIGDCVFR